MDRWWLCSLPMIFACAVAHSQQMEAIEVAEDQQHFVLKPSGRRFVPWGVNYDHDEQGRLLEDYWHEDWPKVESDFQEIRRLGANVVRIHLQFGKFMESAETPHAKSLDLLERLVTLAERTGLYLDLTGLGCYHKRDVPDWYDKLPELDRWNAQARFWEAVASRVAKSPAIFCFDLMNEPVVPGGKRNDSEWLGPPFAGKHFVQFITLDSGGRPRPKIARDWIQHLTATIRRIDNRHMITVGLVDWSLNRPGLTSGFVPQEVAADLDFLCVHMYPEAGKFDAATETLKGFSIGKPVVVEETFPLRCSPQELDDFIAASAKHSAGWISFYWGKPPEELRESSELTDVILLDWLTKFSRRAVQQ